MHLKTTQSKVEHAFPPKPEVWRLPYLALPSPPPLEQIKAQHLLLEKIQAPPPQPSKEMAAANPRQHVPPRVRPMIIPIEKISNRSESEGEEHYRRSYQRRTPLSEELEEIQWPHRLNPTVLPQFN